MKLGLVFALIVLGLVSSSCAHKFAYIQDETVYNEFECQNVNRSYLVHLPTDYDPQKKYPLIMVLHGIFSSPEAVAGFSDFNKSSDEKGFIACYPQGYKDSWSIGIKVGPAPKAGIDDIKFFDMLLDSLNSEYSIDTSKVFFTGISNGGFMTSTLANKLSDRFSGMALICANMFAPIEDYVSDTKPMKVLLIGGTKDPLMKYEGEKFRRKYAFLGFPKTIAYWQERNQYAALSDSTIIDNDPKDKTSVIHYYNANHSNDSRLEMYKIIGGGHGWPGREKDFKRFFLGRISREINTTDLISDFFLKD